jgi:hypothetical protein
MIRSFFLLIVFVIGLAAAALWQGQMYHLRRVLPASLPAWTDQISDTARLRHGEMRIETNFLRPALTLRWQVLAPNSDGLRWALFLTGQGVDIRADLLLPFWPGQVILRNGSGTVPLDDLVDGAGIGGVVRIDRATASIAGLLDQPRPGGDLTATLQRITLDGAPLGEGPLRVELSAEGGLSGTLALRGGLTDIDGALSGTWGAVLGQLDVTVGDVTRLPAAARGALERLGELNGTTLRLSLPVPLPY